MKSSSKAAYLAGVTLFLVICVASYTYSAYFRAKPHSATLSWKASTSVVKGYNILRGTHAGGPYSRINPEVYPGTTYVDSKVVSGMTYYYVTRAVAPTGAESGYSNEVVAVIPQDKH